MKTTKLNIGHLDMCMCMMRPEDCRIMRCCTP